MPSPSRLALALSLTLSPTSHALQKKKVKSKEGAEEGGGGALGGSPGPNAFQAKQEAMQVRLTPEALITPQASGSSTSDARTSDPRATVDNDPNPQSVPP